MSWLDYYKIEEHTTDSLRYYLDRKRPDTNMVIIPEDNILDFELNCDGAMVRSTTIKCLEPLVVEQKLLNELVNCKEKNKMPDTRKILKIYESIEIEKILKNFDKKIKEVELESVESKITKKVREYAQKELKAAFPDYDESKENIITVTFKKTDETTTKISELYEEKEEELEKLNKKIDEINALADIAETFEQKMEILKAYNIVDKKGVFVK